MPDRSLEMELAGARLQLLPQRAIWWPQQRAILAADVHLGKGAEFRKRGMAVPAGSTTDDFQRLADLVADYDAEQLWILGDLFHSGASAGLAAAFANWRQTLRAARVVLVRGNHDGALHIPASWSLEVVTEMEAAGLLLRHEPRANSGEAEIAGHLHPSYRIRAGRADSLRSPAFWLRGERLVMPAFGSFTGGYNITPEARERVFAVGPDCVVEVSARSGRRTA